MRAHIINPGQQFGRWTVIQELERRNAHRLLACRCTCGAVKSVSLHSLRTGTSQSCGCYRLEASKRHGGWRTTEYTIWAHMLYRCSPVYKPRLGCWKNYGGRGIRVCDKWKNSFAAFLEDVGHRPSMDHTLDRINNAGNYEPGNVRWATRSEQRCNQRGNAWQRILIHLARQVGVTEEELRNLVAVNSDEVVARHIAQCFKPADSSRVVQDGPR